MGFAEGYLQGLKIREARAQTQLEQERESRVREQGEADMAQRQKISEAELTLRRQIGQAELGLRERELQLKGRPVAEPLVDLSPLADIEGFERLAGKNVPKSVADNLVNALAQRAKPKTEPQPTSASLAVAAASGDQQAAKALELLRTSTEPVMAIRTLDKEGNPITLVIPKSEAEGKSFPAQPPAETRVKEDARNRTREFIGKLQEIGDRIITKPLSLSQRMTASIRGIEAALANDPDYRTYQDFRAALAAAMGTAEQGARISDFDVKGVYLPMIPDVFKDTKESAQMKWKLIKQRMGVKGAGDQPQGGGAAPPDDPLGIF